VSPVPADPGPRLDNLTLAHKEGWRRFAEAPDRVMPEQLTETQLAGLSPTARAAHDRDRRVWHANLGPIRTPQLAALHEDLWDIADAGQIPSGHPVLAAQQVIDQLIDGDTAGFGLYEAAPQATITALADLRAIAGRVITHALDREIPGDMTDGVLAGLHQLARQEYAGQHAARHRVGAAPPMTAGAALGLSHAVQVMTSEDAGTAADRLRRLTSAGVRLPVYASGLDDWGRNTSDILRRVQLAVLGPDLRPGDQLRYRTDAPAPAVRLDVTGALARARRHAVPSTFWPAWTARLLPPQEGYPWVRGPAPAASLLLAGTRLTHAEAAGLLGDVTTHWRSPPPCSTCTPRRNGMTSAPR
jgi:hypothetical protein